MINDEVLQTYRPDIFLGVLNEHLDASSQLEFILNDSDVKNSSSLPIHFFYSPSSHSGGPIFGSTYSQPLIFDTGKQRPGFMFRVKLIEGVYVATLSYKGTQGIQNNSFGNRNLSKYAADVYSKLVGTFIFGELATSEK